MTWAYLAATLMTQLLAASPKYRERDSGTAPGSGGCTATAISGFFSFFLFFLPCLGGHLPDVRHPGSCCPKDYIPQDAFNSNSFISQ